MAKISARGDREVARWEREGGGGLVLTEKGRLLRKLSRLSNYSLVPPRRGARRWDAESAEKFARALDYLPTRVRR